MLIHFIQVACLETLVNLALIKAYDVISLARFQGTKMILDFERLLCEDGFLKFEVDG